MYIFGRLVRRLVAPLLATTLLATSVAVPMLDRCHGPDVTVEAPGTDGRKVAHDHSICVQASANLGVLSVGSPAGPPAVESVDRRPGSFPAGSDRDPARDYRSRAPPLV